ncbi:alpha/beta fold hydrolase [Agromyces sp. CFH 90414]|uniref:Alpha/beta fold hydrolase n=1 Tax=Agromyces agglutinans TaxID=2662258 RepID=A0A6I2FB33_9MICO|nr:alpha/beta hydrolase [Agromyces agglutinans]MRG59940.1 alpha/beta fold hydrolase [Agromyces agglutinans]
MAEYVDVGGVDTWVDVRGAGERTVVLLHGGMGNSDDLLDSIGRDLEGEFRVAAFDRVGHGRTADAEGAWHYDDMATHAIAVLERLAGGGATGGAAPVFDLVGWSDGGIVALLVALRRPDLVDRLVLIGANFHFDGIHDLPLGDGGEESPLYAGFAERSPDGPERYPVAIAKWIEMITTEPTLTVDDVARIDHPTLVLVGDDDLVKLEHTVALYEALPHGRLCVLPGASHILVFEHLELVASVIGEFLRGPRDPETILPVRRRAAD